MSTTFIVQHRTPRQVKFIPASEVRGDGKGFTYRKLLRSQATLEHEQVMAALGKTMRGLGVRDDLLQIAFETAKSLYPGLMEKASFSPRNSRGRPPMVTVKG